MKKNYIKPVMEMESFIAEEIMSYDNELSNDQGTGYYADDAGYISFREGDTNVLTGIDYSTFDPQ